MKNRYDKMKEYFSLFDTIEENYGKEQLNLIKEKANAEYDRLEALAGDVPKYVKPHLVCILERAGLYNVLREFYPENAYDWIRKCIEAHNIRTHNGISKLTCRKWGAKLFLKMMGVLGDKGFGTSSGFRKNWLEKTNTEMAFDMTECPYVKYLRMFGCPELAKSFCDSDIDVYGNLPNVDFIRTQTLGTGGTKCDFRVRLNFDKK